MKLVARVIVVLVVLYLYLYAFHVTGNVLLNLHNKEDFSGTIFAGISYAIKTFSVAINTHWIRIVRNPRFNRNSVTSVSKWTVGRSRQCGVVAGCICIWLVSSAAFLYRTYRIVDYLSTEDPQVYFAFSFYNLNLTRLGISDAAAKVVIALDWNSYNMLFFVTAVQFTMFLKACGNLNVSFERVMDMVLQIKDMSYKRSALPLAQFRVFDREFKNLLSEFRCLERRFSLPLFLWISESVAYTILTSRRIKLSNFNRVSPYALAVDSLFYTTVYGTVLFYSSRIDEAHKNLYCRLSEKASEIPSDFQELYIQYDLTMKTVSSTRCCLTGFGFYYIDRAFGLTTVGMVFTYLVIVMQI